MQGPLKSQDLSLLLHVNMYIVVAGRVQAGVKLKEIMRGAQCRHRICRQNWHFLSLIVDNAEKLLTLPINLPKF